MNRTTARAQREEKWRAVKMGDALGNKKPGFSPTVSNKGNLPLVSDSGTEHDGNYDRSGFGDILARSLYITQQSVCGAVKSIASETITPC